MPCELELEREQEPRAESPPDFLAGAVRRARGDNANELEERTSRSAGGDQNRDGLSEQREVLGNLAKQYLHDRRSSAVLRCSNDTPESDVTGRRVDRLRISRGGTIAAAIVRCAQV